MTVEEKALKFVYLQKGFTKKKWRFSSPKNSTESIYMNVRIRRKKGMFNRLFRIGLSESKRQDNREDISLQRVKRDIVSHMRNL